MTHRIIKKGDLVWRKKRLKKKIKLIKIERIDERNKPTKRLLQQIFLGK